MALVLIALVTAAFLASMITTPWQLLRLRQRSD
jgi:hypothetical protein